MAAGPAVPAPTKALQRAVHAEMRRVRRRMEPKLAKRASLQAQLDGLDVEIGDLRARLHELAAAAGETPLEVADPRAVAGRAGVLNGRDIRIHALAVLVAEGVEAFHYRDCYARLRGLGLEVGGEKPLATLLSSLTRSPLLQSSTEAGMYSIDLSAEQRIRSRREQLARDLAQLLVNGGWTSRRGDLQREIDRYDRQLSELADTRQLAQRMGETPQTD